jgi:hypothetical protein
LQISSFAGGGTVDTGDVTQTENVPWLFKYTGVTTLK